MTRTAVVGAYDGGNYAALERVGDHLAQPIPHQPRQRLWNITAKQVIVAAGASERPIVFGGNDRPGVMLGSAVRSYLNRFAVAAGRRFAVFTNNNDGWRTATDLVAAGQEVCAVIDARPEHALPADRSGIGQVLADAQVIGTRGWHGLQKVVVATRFRRDDNCRGCARRVRRMESDACAHLSSWRQAGRGMTISRPSFRVRRFRKI